MLAGSYLAVSGFPGLAVLRALGPGRACGRFLRWPEVPRHSVFALATALGPCSGQPQPRRRAPWTRCCSSVALCYGTLSGSGRMLWFPRFPVVSGLLLSFGFPGGRHPCLGRISFCLVACPRWWHCLQGWQSSGHPGQILVVTCSFVGLQSLSDRSF